MGRPPIGKIAMTATERVRRFRAKHRPDPPETKHETKHSTTDNAVASLEARIRELEAELARVRSEGQLTRSHRGSEQTGAAVFSEVGKLRREIVGLKSDIIKLKAALQEEPDAAKLRKKVIDLQVEKASLRQELRRVVKERDKYRLQMEKRFREARHHATRKTYGVIVKALHSDRAKRVTADELAEAERLFIALRPLFDEER